MRKASIEAQTKSTLRLKVDVHVEDKEKISSATTNNTEDVARLKSKEVTLIDQKFESSEQGDSVDDTGTKYKGINISRKMLVVIYNCIFKYREIYIRKN